ncbi:DNA repair protein RecN [uncultured Boseongicola sp.]|jgi:DNA repair protein RecN (Recombination protein N)|uniref:DNA repair protein RecN n=1 Tax=uncultured Boseongicola sp. TaxID=1648499 RepID=UPI002632CE60|nr:DNA repair protein RecN [uncultured Boseongicola sp.]
MLRSLEIRDMLIIDRLELLLQPGLNVLTGETGAGKSILLDSLGFVLGWRGRAELVREGADQGEVIAEFDLTVDHPARAVLAEAGLPVGDTLILRRVNARDGRKTAWVNDRRASGEVLRALSDTLVELHGQNDDRGLLNPSGHRRLLDTFGDLDDLVARCRAAWRDLQGARAALTEAEEVAAALAEEEDFLRHAVGELTELSADAGEDASLDSRRRMMQGAEKIREDVTRAYTALGSGGAEGMMRDASRWLDEAAEQAEGALDTPMAALERAMVELGDAEDGVARALEALAFDVSELERVEERLFAIRALARKHNVLPDALSDLTETLGAKLAALDGGAAELADLKAAVLDAEDVYDTAADALGAARAQAAEALDTAMAKELAPLKLERAVFATDIAETDAGPDGRDTVAFTIATNPGAPSGALNKIASGGELSRFLLALKVCLTSGVDGLTLIFDEIDRGVGGATADAVGRRLAELSVDSQVLVVTHSPQVAARGAHHWRVEKSVTKGATLSTVVALDDLERIDEVARMLSGDTVTDAARVAAKTLLNA